MSASLPVSDLAAVSDLPASGQSDWEAWLSDQLDVDWRAGEWNQSIWLFTGDPDNPATALGRCRTQACTMMLTASTLCSSCRKEHRRGGLSIDEFVATHVPVRAKRYPTSPQPRCIVRRDGVRCGRGSYSRDLCVNHHWQWRAALHRPGDLDFNNWVTTVAVPGIGTPELCVVMGCDQERFRGSRLCHRHYSKQVREKPRRPVDEWVLSQTPFLHEQHFSLAPLRPAVRLEVLYALQRRDARGYKVDPALVRSLVKHVGQLPSLTGVTEERVAWAASLTSGNHRRAFLVAVLREVQAGHNQMLGVAPTDPEIWDSSLIKLLPEFSSAPYRYGNPVDFTTISQSWLRTVVLEWARQTNPSRDHIWDALRAFELASKTLERRVGGGHDPKSLGFDDVNAIVEAMKDMRNPDTGDLYSYSHRRALNGRFFAVIEFGRRAGLMDDVSGGFARHRNHFIPGSPSGDDQPGRAIPEPVIAQLDAHLSTLGDDFPYRGWSQAQVKHMLRTAYIVLRDAGRRPEEICRLRLECLLDDDGDVLIWDNFKRQRFHRRLPIPSTTAQAIRDWRSTRASVPMRPASADYLFPARGPSAGPESSKPYLSTADLQTALRTWVRAIPEIHSDIVDKDGKPLPFDRSLVYPYAFRHSYAQRHADADVKVDVLKDLMDHRSVNTTVGYYKITLKRKRDAVEKVRHLVIDRTGKPAPAPSAKLYELRSVAVPFGSCIEPSNVKAGGQACPIRFQCSGCGFYRPDPSYLPAIDQHINSLKAERETAIAMDAADFVVRNFTDQIEAYDRVRTWMREALAKLDPEERRQIEEASAVLHSARASQGLRSLPLTVIHRGSGHNND